MAQGREVRQDRRQADQSAVRAALQIDGQRGVVLAFEDRRRQARQLGVGADLDEGSGAVAVHGLDHRRELDRPGELIGQQVASLVGRGRVRRAGRVGEDRDRPPRNLDAAKRLPQRIARLGDEPTMKRRRDRQSLGRCLLGREQPLRPLDLADRAGQDALARPVLVGDDDVEPVPPNELGEMIGGGEDGEHGARIVVAGAIGHERAAVVRQEGERLGVDPPGRVQRGQFAEAVAGGHVGANAEIGEDLEQSERDRADRRLGGPGVAERLLLPPSFVVREGRRGVNPIAQPGAGRGRRRIGRFKGREHPGEPTGRVAEHADVLRALAGEQKGQPARRLALAEEHSPRRRTTRADPTGRAVDRRPRG